jgi:hypothetical protein
MCGTAKFAAGAHLGATRPPKILLTFRNPLLRKGRLRRKVNNLSRHIRIVVAVRITTRTPNQMGSGGHAARAVCLYQSANRLREFPGEWADGTKLKEIPYEVVSQLRCLAPDDGNRNANRLVCF